MKKLLLLLLAFISIATSAQLDREHWFAPMVDRVGNGSQFQSIYMSTNETTPFKVDVYNNNVVIGSVMISKNNPAKFNVTRSMIITTFQSDLFRPVTKGIYLKGDKPFFASLRFSIMNHGEILTSKGTAGIGTEFRAVMAPITVNNSILNFMTSVMATEDNTTVTVTEFNPNVGFSDNVPRSQINFILNKGQSYIIDGRGNNFQNYTGFIGAKIVANKPVSITNGNFNGQYAGSHSTSSDILMDQGVPVEKLGQEFVLMKGNGTTVSNMEKAIIVATEDNTQIYVNGSVTPVATLNTGQFYTTDNSAYINQGFNHYNMHIKSTKNIYVYQLLAGDSGSSMVATGGFNYIPPLSCYLPKKIDEIGRIDENEYSSNGVSYSATVPTKLNIITERGATVDVKRNGTSIVLSALNGPFNVVGNANWVTYSIPGVYGNIAVFSSKAVTAGISAGNDAVGYGGYFAGFSFIPAITKTEGDCLPGVKLEVTEGFDSYEWLIKNPDGTYSPAPGTNNTFTYIPPQAGIYAVKVKQGSCAEIQTQDFKFYNCTTFTNYDYNSCGNEIITPAFALSSQAVNPSTVQIVTPPTKGTLTIAADGKVIYTANPGVSGIDTFKFSFCGIGPIPDCETVQITIKMIEKYDRILEECSINGIATYNLSLAPVSPDTDITKTYFTTQNGAENDIAGDRILNFTAYPSANTSVYVRIKNSIGCVAVAKIDLRAKLAPEVKENLYTKLHCDEDVDGKIDGIYKVDLATITPVVLVQASNFVVKYYSDAGLSNNITGVYSFTGDTSIWIKVDAPNGCPSVTKEIQLKTGAKSTLITSSVTKDVCDLNLDNSEAVNLADYLSFFTGAGGTAVTYFNTIADAQNNQNPVTANQTITADRSFFYRITVPSSCANIGTLNLKLSAGTPSTTLPATVNVCQGATTTLNVGTGYTAISWSTGATTTTINAGAGTYWVDLTNASGCVYRQTVTVVDSPKPQWNITAYNATNCDDNFDGIINVRFSNITPLIVQNSALFTVEYSLFSDFRTLLPNDWTYAADTTVFVRAYSTVCPAEVKQIDLKIGNTLPLLTPATTVTVCDSDVNGTENINLATYRNLFTTDAAATVRYFATLANAEANTPTISAAQALTGNKTFYYRFSKAGFCDVIGTLNLELKAATPTALLDSYTVCQGSSITLNAESSYTAWLWRKGTTTVSTTQTAVLTAGVYTVSFTNASGCVFTKTITVTDSPKPQWNITAYNAVNCDDNFDGIINVKFATITPLIIQNAALFTVEYSLFSDFRTLLPNDWTYSADATVFVRAYSTVCPAEVKQIDFKVGNSLPLLHASAAVKVCDDDSDAVKSVNLANYLKEFTADSGVTASYYLTLADAQNNVNGISNQVSISGTATYYLRFHKNNFCDVIGQLTVNVQIPKKSTELADKEICPGTTTVLDAGPGFDAYLWSNGATTSSVTVPVGNYWVDLTHNGCTYRQTVSVTAVSLPEITSVQIQGSTVTVTVTGGNPPYQYAIDGGTYQSSNIFTNVRGGDHIISVISADNCSPVTATINVIELYNAITPNGDGINDVLNYSALLQKEEPFLQIFDRYGKLVFTGDQNNRFTWDGRIVGKGVGTGTFWYVMSWKEPGFTAVTEYSGWVLVKNRE
ncbi:T9SS type B sorting domain-containing protein [Chryseobacterium sp. VAUSW3]|uniref:T9SS type B sorting domain-containing protein n=1 Tax=Chryseobacterium sp. VAUSW3 TaxID=2010998 RepID=UPI000B4CFB0D|nr:T9SS type B sorting domain-containing protein [Chryseobacterium sp. VAUSW3]OWR13325.1 hypothetical protein CDW55_10440 [Chryseobacterium sp. VAUSW3]